MVLFYEIAVLSSVILLKVLSLCIGLDLRPLLSLFNALVRSFLRSDFSFSHDEARHSRWCHCYSVELCSSCSSTWRSKFTTIYLLLFPSPSTLLSLVNPYMSRSKLSPLIAGHQSPTQTLQLAMEFWRFGFQTPS